MSIKRLSAPLQLVLRIAFEMIQHDIVFKHAYPEGDDAARKFQYLRTKVLNAADQLEETEIYNQARTNYTFIKPICSRVRS